MSTYSSWLHVGHLSLLVASFWNFIRGWLKKKPGGSHGWLRTCRI